MLSVSGQTSYNENASASIIASTLTISDIGTLDGATVSIDTSIDSNDSLGVQGQTGTNGTVDGLTWTYDASKGLLRLSGEASAATYQSALRQITYSNSSDAPVAGDRNIQFALGANVANPENGHFYEFVGGTFTWTEARDAAAASTYLGMQGYLATVTSEAENNFLANTLFPAGWLGGSDVAEEGEWRWVTGPEAGEQFWLGDENGSATNSLFNSWEPGEPNNSSDEDYLQFFAEGTWHDQADVASASGYTIEYGGLAGDTGGPIVGTATVTVASVNDAPTGTVTIAGTVVEDGTLTASNDIADVDGLGDISYQWQEGGEGAYTDIDGATGETFTPGDDQVGKQLRVVASYEDQQNTAEAVTSAATVEVANINDAPTGGIIINGDVAENSELTADTSNLADADGLGQLTYQWQEGGEGGYTNIDGATSASFTPDDAQVGQQLRLQVSYTDDGGAEEIVSSETGFVTNVNDAPTIEDGQSFMVAENVQPGTQVGTVAAADVDSALTFAITGGNEAGLFEIDNAGVISLASNAVLDYETVASYDLSVEVTEATGDSPLSASTSLTIDVSDVEFGLSGEIFWQNNSTGGVMLWQLVDSQPQVVDLLGQPDTNWKIVGTDDFDKNGSTDLFWRNQTTGDNAIWLLDGGNFQSAVNLSSQPDTSWTIAGTGNFSDDDNIDVLWRNQETGDNVIWYLEGTQWQSSAFLTSVSDTNWQMVGSGDFTGDQKDDILWRNEETGQNAVWVLDGPAWQETIFLASVGSEWTVGGAEDYNRDGKVDILWRNAGTGQNAVWEMDGTQFQQTTFISPLVDTNWQIVQN